jgi:hypothetical protein
VDYFAYLVLGEKNIYTQTDIKQVFKKKERKLPGENNRYLLVLPYSKGRKRAE